MRIAVQESDEVYIAAYTFDDLEMAVELCPRSIILDHGQIIADGRTVELLADEPLMLAHGLERPHILHHLHPH